MSDKRLAASALGFNTGTISRVQRSGNSKMIPIPAEVARRLHIEIGDEYVLDAVGSQLVYNRSTPEVSLACLGDEMIGVIDEAIVVGVNSQSTLPPLDWDF